MVWILLAGASLLIVGLAIRNPRFRRIAEPALSVLVAIGLISAFVVWRMDDNARPRDPVSPVTADRPVDRIAPTEIRLENLTFEKSTPASSYVVTATIHNDSAAFLDYFTLDVTLDDCPGGACRTIGRDDALVIARISPGHSAALRTTLVFPSPKTGPPDAPRWTATIVKIQSSPAGP
ncbi:hypothetical protein ASG25_13085 [Rhizobium sp. Leaf384]|uniref:hypothetical protein n=1 Tax=unclassified Rhizobium TaxID=2613769 RepID=UPI0007139528|nr:MULTISPECIES: hypothetical protein [unclassified Rhizobium]KQS79450.1 hypothetical protein ASG25_13085 [Rhizobium sp. Leaf384]KQS85091.1 hypothetical protein ASG58_19775 [Rhizobium sp. Leaf383]